MKKNAAAAGLVLLPRARPQAQEPAVEGETLPSKGGSPESATGWSGRSSGGSPKEMKMTGK